MICFILTYMKFITIKSFVIYKCIHLFLFNIDKFNYTVLCFIHFRNYIFIYIQYSKQNDFFHCSFSYKSKEIDSLYYVCSIYCT